MTYILKKNKKNIPKFSHLMFGLGFLVIILFFGFSDYIKGLSHNLSLPFLKAGDNLYQESQSLAEQFWDKERLAFELDQTRKKLEAQNILLSDLATLKYENTKLRETLNFLPQRKSIVASVLGRPPQTPFDTIIINKGKKDGLNADDLVLSATATFIGRIKEVHNNSATALLNSSSEVSFSGIVDRTGESIAISGRGDGSIFAKILADFDIRVGDNFIFPYDTNYNAGTVGAIEEEIASGSKNVYIHLPVNIKELTYVYVMLQTEQ